MAASSQIRILRRAFNAHAGRQVRQLVTTLVRVLAGLPGQGGTPRDTQWASSNWIVQVGSPFEGPVGSKADVSRDRQEAGIASMDLYHLSLGNVWVTNSVPYVPRLNDGSSRQAPAGFVQAAILRAEVTAGRRPR